MGIATHVSQHAGVKVLAISGELNGQDDARIVAQAGDLLSTPGDRLILDLHGVTFLNSTGLGTLVRLCAQANVQEQRIVIARPSAMVDGVLRATQLVRFFEVFYSLDDASAALE